MIVGIAGPKRSGKDTLAWMLSSARGVEVHSFAAPIRKFVAEIAGLGGDLDALELHKETPIPWLDGITPRQMMQTLGTEWGRRMVHPELWLRSLAARLPEQGAIVCDVRFDNEAEAIRKLGGKVIRLSRPGAGQGDEHASERPISDHLVDFEIANDGSAVQLLARAISHLGPLR